MVGGQGGAGGMVSREEQEIARGVESVLSAASPNLSSLQDVVEQVESKLGFQVSHKIDFIRTHIHYLLRPPPQPQPQHLYHKDHFALEQLPIPRPLAQQHTTLPPDHLPFSQQLQFEPYAASPPPPTTSPSSGLASPPPPPQPQSSKKRSFFNYYFSQVFYLFVYCLFFLRNGSFLSIHYLLVILLCLHLKTVLLEQLVYHLFYFYYAH